MKKTTLLATATMLLAGSIFAGETLDKKELSLKEALTGGKIKGTIGTYFEHLDYDGQAKDSFGWQTGYLKLKYETQRWNGLKLGASLLAHTELYNDTDGDFKGNNVDAFDNDIEEKYSIPELYLDWNFAGKTSLRLGRFNHKKFTHIDDAQSEGFYLQSKDIENLTLTFGAIREFAELDYDDGEDFGQKDGKQDLSNDAKYGRGSDDYLIFAEAKYEIDNLMINPYFMSQDDYAQVVGADIDVNGKINESITIGLKGKAYNVSPSGKMSDTMDDAFCYSLAPYIKVGGFSAEIGYAEGDGDADDTKKAMNKPAWMRDYLTGFDQDKTFGKLSAQGASGQWVKLGYKTGGWKFHVAHGIFDNDESGATDDSEINETEFIVGYKFDNGLDLQTRYFMVDYENNADHKDYDKVEVRLRYKF